MKEVESSDEEMSDAEEAESENEEDIIKMDFDESAKPKSTK